MVAIEARQSLLGLRVLAQLGKQRKSIYQLAQDAGLPVSVVQRVCAGQGKQTSIWTVVKLAEVLQCSVDYLTGLIEKEGARGL